MSMIYCFIARDVARIIVQSKQWEDALRNTTEGSVTKEPTTPFRKLILKMPGQ